MALVTAEAILLDVRDLQDRDRIVTFLARDLGKKSGVAKGARTRHSRFGGQLQPLAKVHVTWYEKEGKELVRISAVELVQTARRLQEDLDGILLGSYLADHVLEFAQEGDPSDHLYRLLDSTLEALLAGVDRDLAARYFETWMLRLAGVFPSPKACPSCGRPFVSDDGEEGAVVPPNGETLLCFDCGGRSGYIARPETLELLRRFGRESLAEVAEHPPLKRTLREVEEVCGRVRRSFLQRELRSYEVLQQTLR
ncbi:MAG: DNA repair protein RecO [Acidobacteriota bacterium]